MVGITTKIEAKIWRLLPLRLTNFALKNLHFTFDHGKIVDSDVQGQPTVVVWATIHLIIPTFAHNTTTTASEI